MGARDGDEELGEEDEQAADRSDHNHANEEEGYVLRPEGNLKWTWD